MITIGFRNGNVIFEALRYRFIKTVDHAEGSVAVLHRIGDDPNSHQIVDLINCCLIVAARPNFEFNDENSAITKNDDVGPLAHPRD